MVNLTEQEAFNQVVAHLRKQGRKSIGLERPFYCMYRSEEGMKCAVGALIPDELYFPEMENGGSVRHNPDVSSLFPHNLLPLLESLQRIHDRGTVGGWEASLREVAKAYELEMPE